MNQKTQKLLGIPFLVLFLNLFFIIFTPFVFKGIINLITIIIFNFFICIDIVIRPISAQVDQYKKSILIISFLLMPLMTFIPYFEYYWLLQDHLPVNFINWTECIGIAIMTFGGLITLVSRIQIGKYGGPKITIEKSHQLITSGMYKHIRNPLYLGFLLLFLGYNLAFGSIISTCIIPASLFLILRSRINLEEKLLFQTFGEEYVSYMKRTKRLIPFIY